MTNLPASFKYKRNILHCSITSVNMPLTLPLQHWWFAAPSLHGYWFCHVLWYYWTHQCNKGLHLQAPVLQLPSSIPQSPSQQSPSNLKNQLPQSVFSLKCRSALECKEGIQCTGLCHGPKVKQQVSSTTYLYHVTHFRPTGKKSH